MRDLSPNREAELLRIYLRYVAKHGRDVIYQEHPAERRVWRSFLHRFTIEEQVHLDWLRTIHIKSRRK